jgi:IS5 family transposase
MNKILDKLTEIYCFVDDFLQTNRQLSEWRRSNHRRPLFSDAEVLTIALLQSEFGVESLRKTHTLIAENFAEEFPALCGYKQFIRRLHRLTGIVQKIFEVTVSFYKSQVYLMDAKPIPVCLPPRHRRVRLLRDDGAYFGKSTKGWFFGFKLHVLATEQKKICNVVLTPANYADRSVAEALTEFLAARAVIGDLGYRGAKLQDELLEENDCLLITKQDAKRRKLRLPPVRQRIEAGFLFSGIILLIEYFRARGSVYGIRFC